MKVNFTKNSAILQDVSKFVQAKPALTAAAGVTTVALLALSGYFGKQAYDKRQVTLKEKASEYKANTEKFLKKGSTDLDLELLKYFSFRMVDKDNKKVAQITIKAVPYCQVSSSDKTEEIDAFLGNLANLPAEKDVDKSKYDNAIEKLLTPLKDVEEYKGKVDEINAAWKKS